MFDTPASGPLCDAVRSSRLFGIAIVVAPSAGRPRARVALAIHAGRAEPPEPQDAALRDLAATSPAARSLAFAETIARGRTGRFDYPIGAAVSLRIDVDGPPSDAAPIG